MSRCSSPGTPRLMLSPLPFRVFQRPDTVTMVFEWNRLSRVIDVHPEVRSKDPQDEIGTMRGTTEGRWEGDTLVATSTRFSGKKLLDDLLPNSDRLELTEHLRLRGHNTLEDRITIRDPEIFTRPWDAVLAYERQSDDLYPFPEDVCLDRKDGGEPPLPRAGGGK
jgi:hypothetical protein